MIPNANESSSGSVSLKEETTVTCAWSRDGLSVEKVAVADLPTEWGDFKIAGYRSRTSDEEFVALYKGELQPNVPTLVRIHSQCLTGDVFASTKCDCGRQLHRTLEMIQEEGRGAIVYQQQEGRGIGILNKIRAYALQDQGADTVEANELLGLAVDSREYRQCAEILYDLGLCQVRVISNNPMKLQALEEAGLKIVERVSIQVDAQESAARYLRTKKEKMGHLLEIKTEP
jgi:3,4-dihydroxy 2-butanone 4-phosphate synthase/GTP cyclohydrolase II